MSIFLLTGLLTSLMAAPWGTFRIFRLAAAWELRQVAVDNAGILMGRADRATLNYLVTANRIVRALELVHHPFHACAHTPAAAAGCAAKDLAIEAELVRFHAAVGKSARAMWVQSTTIALAHLRGAGTGLASLRRPELRLAGVRCHVCHQEVYWELSPASGIRETYLRAQAPVPIDVSVRLRGRSLLKDEHWDYLLEAGEG